MSRPYRSKRHRPCDQCRERKLGCQTDDGLSCIRCRSADLACTFDHPPPKRPRRESSQSSWFWDEVTPDNVQPSMQPLEQQQQPPPVGQSFSLDDLPVDGVSPAVSGQLVFGRSPTQFVQSLDQLQNLGKVLLGVLGEKTTEIILRKVSHRLNLATQYATANGAVCNDSNAKLAAGV